MPAKLHWLAAEQSVLETQRTGLDLKETPMATLTCPNANSYIPDFKIGRMKKNTPTSLKLRADLCICSVCIRYNKPEGNNGSVNKVLAALLFLPYKLLLLHVTKPILIHLSGAPHGKNSLSFESSR